MRIPLYHLQNENYREVELLGRRLLDLQIGDSMSDFCSPKHETGQQWLFYLPDPWTMFDGQLTAHVKLWRLWLPKH